MGSFNRQNEKPRVWRVRLLGRIEVLSPSHELVRFRSRSATSLFAFLALKRHTEFSNTHLMEIFWPGSTWQRQAQNLRRAICDLRKILEDSLPHGSVVVTKNSLISVDSSRIETDVENFLDLTNMPYSRCALAQAVGLYSGPLLAPLDDVWILADRMEIEEHFTQSVARLTMILLGEARFGDAIQLCRAAVLAAPYREEIHALLISAYRQADMQTEALRQFEMLERLLDDLWGVRPSQKTELALSEKLRPKEVLARH
jgi:DNA-binding SARP family transcriptional activator